MSVRQVAALRRRNPLEAPRRALRVGPHYDPDAFGRFSEAVARVIGTARFLVAQTVIVIIWIGMNIAFPSARFDEYPFILLTLALSLQAAYAAPLILLAQTRQAERDRLRGDRDRTTAEHTREEAEFLAREVAHIRLAVGELGQELHDQRAVLEELREALAGLSDPRTAPRSTPGTPPT
jgi:uncharacterized membrane protein